MRFITIRDLCSNSAKIQRELPKEKGMVLISNGKPIAILTATSAERIEESLSIIRRLRAMEAVDYMQRQSVEAGADRVSLEEINKEITAARKERRTI